MKKEIWVMFKHTSLFFLSLLFSFSALADSPFSMGCENLAPSKPFDEEVHASIKGEIETSLIKSIDGKAEIEYSKIKKYAIKNIPNADIVQISQNMAYMLCKIIENHEISNDKFNKSIAFMQFIISQGLSDKKKNDNYLNIEVDNGQRFSVHPLELTYLLNGKVIIRDISTGKGGHQSLSIIANGKEASRTFRAGDSISFYVDNIKYKLSAIRGDEEYYLYYIIDKSK